MRAPSLSVNLKTLALEEVSDFANSGTPIPGRKERIIFGTLE